MSREIIFQDRVAYVCLLTYIPWETPAYDVKFEIIVSTIQSCVCIVTDPYIERIHFAA